MHWDEFVPVSDATVATVEAVCKSFNTGKTLSACVRRGGGGGEVHKQLLDSIYSALKPSTLTNCCIHIAGVGTLSQVVCF